MALPPNCKYYRMKTLYAMRPYVPGEDMTGVSVAEGITPAPGGMIIVDLRDHAVRIYITESAFTERYEAVE